MIGLPLPDRAVPDLSREAGLIDLASKSPARLQWGPDRTRWWHHWVGRVV